MIQVNKRKLIKYVVCFGIFALLGAGGNAYACVRDGSCRQLSEFYYVPKSGTCANLGCQSTMCYDGLPGGVPDYTISEDGDPDQCLLHTGQTFCCYKSNWTEGCNGCVTGGDPQARSICAGISLTNTNGTPIAGDPVAGQAYTAHVSMTNIGTRSRDSWNLAAYAPNRQDWPRRCDGVETATNPEDDYQRMNTCPITLIAADALTNLTLDIPSYWGVTDGVHTTDPDRWAALPYHSF